jgi:hypothetical protein
MPKGQTAAAEETQTAHQERIAHFALADNHLFGNRIRQTWRIMKYWWQTRIKNA